jgi:hypothetical protein
MQTIPGKLDCTRSGPRLCAAAAQIFLFVTFLCIILPAAFAQPSAPPPTHPPSYPEVAWRTPTSYCNPYFGFRFQLSPQLKSEPIYLPVLPARSNAAQSPDVTPQAIPSQAPPSQSSHMLLATRVQRVDRDAQIFISALEDSSEDSAHQAARERVHVAHERGLVTSGPNTLSVHDHSLFRLRISGDPQAPGDESSYLLVLRGHIIHVAIFSHDPDLASSIDSAIEHIEFFEPHSSACTEAPPDPPAAVASNESTPPAPPASGPKPSAPSAYLYYGPSLPTELVESTIKASPGSKIPDGKFAHGNFTSPELGVHVSLPPNWQPLPNEEAYHVTELMRDPISDPSLADRRRALFHACSRVIFTAHAPRTELTTLIHPTLAIAAMPAGCIPDLTMPPATANREKLRDFATLLLRSLGVLQMTRASIRRTPSSRLIFTLDGSLPYQVPGELLARRLSLRVSATTSGPWLLFIYSVTATPSAQRDLESRIGITTPESAAAK